VERGEGQKKVARASTEEFELEEPDERRRRDTRRKVVGKTKRGTVERDPRTNKGEYSKPAPERNLKSWRESKERGGVHCNIA